MRLSKIVLILSLSLSSLNAQDSLTDTLKREGVLSKIIEDDSYSIELIEDKNTFVMWVVAATAPSLHLGHLASLNIVKKYQKEGHPLIILIDDTFAGYDPSRKTATQSIDKDIQQSNSKEIEKQIKNILGNNTPIVLFSNIDSTISLVDVIKYSTVLNYKKRQESLKNLSDPTLRDFLFPIIDAHYNLHILKKKNLESIIEIVGEDQIPNAEFIKEYLEGNNKKVVFLIHPLIYFSDGKKIAKNQNLGPFINNMADIKEFINTQDDEQITLLWHFFSSDPLPLTHDAAKNEIIDIISKQLNLN